AVARPLGVAQRLDKGLVAEPVQFSGDCFQTDIGHSFTSSAPRPAPPLYVYAVPAPPDGSAYRTGRPRTKPSSVTSSWSIRSARMSRAASAPSRRPVSP